jgi:hypothetical protein
MQHSAKSDMLIANLRFWKFDVETGWSPFMMKRTHRMRDRTAILISTQAKAIRTGRDPLAERIWTSRRLLGRTHKAARRVGSGAAEGW